MPGTKRRDFLIAAAGGTLARRLSGAEALLAEAVRAGKLRAAVSMVATGRQRFTRAFGAAAPDTVFLLASVTKPKTAAVLMRLVDEGKLKPDDPVSARQTVSGIAMGSGGGWAWGKSSSVDTFGHSGATGVTAWMDPQRDLSCVVLTTLPSAESQATLLGPVSDAVAAAL